MREDPRLRLTRHAERRRSHQAALRQTQNELRAAVIDAAAAHLPISEIARLAGVTRATVYAWTARNSGSRDGHHL